MPGKPPNNPLIAILGTTGTGKSQLAVDIALRFNGEVINGDAVQMYDGLPIITNKMPVDERKGVPHHLLGCVGLEEPTWKVDRFVHGAMDAINDIQSRGRTPILVGGTHYYTQSLLFRNPTLVAQPEQQVQDEESGSDGDSSDAYPILNSSAQDMHAKLREIDPVMASRWHPNDKRHIRRSLEIWLKTGRRASEVYAEQQARGSTPVSPNDNTANEHDIVKEDPKESPEKPSTTTTIPALRFPTLILWTHTPSETLTQRLNARVATMYATGLVTEAQHLHDFALAREAAGNPVDLTRGVFIAIGYKQFLPLIRHLREHASNGDGEGKEAPARQKIAKECIEMTQGATRRYAKAQLRWLRIKLMNALQRAQADHIVYVLDTSDPAGWAEKALEPAAGYVRNFMEGRAMRDNYAVSPAVAETLRPLRDYDLSLRRDLWAQRVCEVCGVTAVTEDDWARHVDGTRHKRAVKRLQHREERRNLTGRSDVVGMGDES